MVTRFCSNSSFYIKSVLRVFQFHMLPVTTSEVGFTCGRFPCKEKKKNYFSNILLGDKLLRKDRQKRDVKNSSVIIDRITMRWSVILYVRRESFCQRILGFISNELGG